MTQKSAVLIHFAAESLNHARVELLVYLYVHMMDILELWIVTGVATRYDMRPYKDYS